MSTGATSSKFSISRKLITIPVQITSIGIHYITPRNLRELEAPSLCTCLYHRLFGKAQLHHTCSSYTYSYTGGANSAKLSFITLAPHTHTVTLGAATRETFT
ncbi:hypothetical protein FRX31_009220 [Thalictrum thalictroides]|uniref:Uncharacterized protein n=1 Tax=Thalictrum thalictroides TaxID=46969 RepID=A0A7J6WVV7_THATH|nr:hypothetical protein FRX31_009220 [Thalictrum thalictroides]